MSNALTRSISPEEREFSRYLDGIDVRRARIAELQTSLAESQIALNAFAGLYESRVGSLLLRLDHLRLDIERFEFLLSTAVQQPSITDEQLEDQTSQRFGPSAEDMTHREQQFADNQQRRENKPTHEQLDEQTRHRLRELYRTLAKCFHPDLTRDAEEKRRREKIMTRLNEAFASL